VRACFSVESVASCDSVDESEESANEKGFRLGSFGLKRGFSSS